MWQHDIQHISKYTIYSKDVTTNTSRRARPGPEAPGHYHTLEHGELCEFSFDTIALVWFRMGFASGGCEANEASKKLYPDNPSHTPGKG